MNNKYLVVNAGSSSLKFSLYQMPEEKELINGYVEKIGLDGSSVQIKKDGNTDLEELSISNHEAAIKVMLDKMMEYQVISDVSEIKGIGHRVVDGGEYYSNSVIIDDEVIEVIKKLTPFVPLHHPGEITGINAMKKMLPDVEMVAVFDTSFHQTIPEVNYIYPIPYEYYEKYGVRKYGFHGTSHRYITEYMKEKLNKEDVNLIICHIGSGASISAIKDGKCIDTSMGLGAIDGLMMGTRCGSIDPSLIKYLVNERNISIDKLFDDFNKRSGLVGLCGVSDLRDVQKMYDVNDKKALLAMDIYTKDIVKYIAEYFVELDGNIDGIIFTAGGGESSVFLREIVVNKLSKAFGIKLDVDRNKNISRYTDTHEGVITTSDSKFPVIVVPTDEEIIIARDTYNLTNKDIKINNDVKKKIKRSI